MGFGSIFANLLKRAVFSGYTFFQKCTPTSRMGKIVAPVIVGFAQSSFGWTPQIPGLFYLGQTPSC